MNVSNINTPAIVVDLEQLEKNIINMADAVSSNKVKLRPHIKTHKIPEFAEMQIKNGASGITVAKVSEAEIMASYGINDILVGNEIVGKSKIEALATLTKNINIKSCVDSLEGAKMLSDTAMKYGISFPVLLDVNTGLNRAGCEPEIAVELAEKISGLPGVQLVGVFSFAGYKPGIPNVEERKKWALQEANIAVSILKDMQAKGINAKEVSVGGTSSAVFAAEVEGVTEVRPGTYVFNDYNYSRMGISSLDECALKIHTTVISRPTENRAVIDAGSKTLTTDKKIMDNGEDPGFGYIVQCPESKITGLWEEHGVIALDEEGRHLKVGDIIEIIPNHVCPTVNLSDSLYGMRNNIVGKEYEIRARGKVT